MMGTLHIEMAIQYMIGHVLKDTGWTEMLSESNLTTEGRADAMTRSGHVKRTRYGHQVTLKVLFNLMKKAYDIEFHGNIFHLKSGKANVLKSILSFSFGTSLGS